MLDLYCERTDPGFWAEPVNALTNLGFVVVAWLLWRRAQRARLDDFGIAALGVTIVAIGLGSFLFHTLASNLARWLDLLPIFIFQLLYLGLYCRRVAGLTRKLTGLLVLAFLLAVMITAAFQAYLNGSLIYAPTLLVLLLLGEHWRRCQRARPWLLPAAAALFLLAVALRSIDLQVCLQFEAGSHFAWHLLTALVICLAVLALIMAPLADRVRTTK